MINEKTLAKDVGYEFGCSYLMDDLVPTKEKLFESLRNRNTFDKTGTVTATSEVDRYQEGINEILSKTSEPTVADCINLYFLMKWQKGFADIAFPKG